MVLANLFYHGGFILEVKSLREQVSIRSIVVALDQKPCEGIAYAGAKIIFLKECYKA